jgi:hypothetical protein
VGWITETFLKPWSEWDQVRAPLLKTEQTQFDAGLKFGIGDTVRVIKCDTSGWLNVVAKIEGRSRRQGHPNQYKIVHGPHSMWFDEDKLMLEARTDTPIQNENEFDGIHVDYNPTQQTTTGDPQVTEVKKETPIVFNTYFCTAFNTQSGKIYEEGKVVSAKTRDGAKLKIAVKLDLPAKVDIEDVTITAVAQSPN